MEQILSKQIFRILTNNNLSPVDKIILSLLNLDKESLLYSNSEFKKVVGITPPTLQKSLKKFKDMDIVDIEYYEKGGRKHRKIILK